MLFWDPETYTAKRPLRNYQAKAAVRTIACNSQYVYVYFEDKNLAQYKLNEDGEWDTVLDTFVQAEEFI